MIILTRFPFVHSDETWLSGLSRNILETGNYAVTETFFDLYPRHPHAIKSLFHSIQIIFISCFGYDIFTVRMVSFLFGLLTLLWFYKLCRHIFDSKNLAFSATLFLALDIQFIYASHFARQEIILLFVLIFSLHYFLTHLVKIKVVHHFILGIIIGLSIGLHPNSFIISLPSVCLYLFHIIFTKKLKVSGLLIYTATAACFACGYFALSLSFDANFIENYIHYGSQFGVTNPLSSKFPEVLNFYLKLYYGISGTYYTPDIRLEFYLFGVAFLASLATLFSLFKEKESPVREGLISIMLAILAVNAGIIFIGRFSQTSIIFLVPLFYILVTYVLRSMKKRLKFYVTPILVVIIALNSALNILPYLNHSYDRYLEEIGKVVNKEETVLANLNAEMAFDNRKLYDYRNLAFLTENNLTFEQYILRNHISYIIYPDEMDFIFAYRPAWNQLYGNISLYYADMQKFLQTKCQLVYEFSEPTYGMRIAQYINKKDWRIRIYKINQ
ncbi:MAG: 4-amino-4-deoxy-L-arabinose transferase [Peptococcaceae bacterium]|nr:4-amino-4-deoxy-L-arabinose transferase [Peptococcaceae bacterium]